MSAALKTALREACAELREHNDIVCEACRTPTERIEAWERLANEPDMAPGQPAGDRDVLPVNVTLRPEAEAAQAAVDALIAESRAHRGTDREPVVLRHRDSKPENVTPEPDVIAWECYLALLREPIGRFGSAHVDKARAVWAAFRQLAPHLSPPQTAPTEEGLLSMVWDAGDHHLEADISPDLGVEWFYLNRSTGQTVRVQVQPDPAGGAGGAADAPRGFDRPQASLVAPVHLPGVAPPAMEECARCGVVGPVDVACRGCQAILLPGDEPPPRPCCHRHPAGDGWCILPDGHNGPHYAPPIEALPAVDFGPRAATTTRRGQP